MAQAKTFSRVSIAYDRIDRAIVRASRGLSMTEYRRLMTKVIKNRVANLAAIVRIH
jgi:hypothetical protein